MQHFSQLGSKCGSAVASAGKMAAYVKAGPGDSKTFKFQTFFETSN